MTRITAHRLEDLCYQWLHDTINIYCGWARPVATYRGPSCAVYGFSLTGPFKNIDYKYRARILRLLVESEKLQFHHVYNLVDSTDSITEFVLLVDVVTQTGGYLKPLLSIGNAYLTQESLSLARLLELRCPKLVAIDIRCKSSHNVTLPGTNNNNSVLANDESSLTSVLRSFCRRWSLQTVRFSTENQHQHDVILEVLGQQAKCLETLEMQNSRISDAGLYHLLAKDGVFGCIRHPGCKMLKHLKVNMSDSVTDECMVHLVQYLPHLQTVSYSHLLRVLHKITQTPKVTKRELLDRRSDTAYDRRVYKSTVEALTLTTINETSEELCEHAEEYAKVLAMMRRVDSLFLSCKMPLVCSRSVQRIFNVTGKSLVELQLFGNDLLTPAVTGVIRECCPVLERLNIIEVNCYEKEDADNIELHRKAMMNKDMRSKESHQLILKIAGKNTVGKTFKNLLLMKQFKHVDIMFCKGYWEMIISELLNCSSEVLSVMHSLYLYSDCEMTVGPIIGVLRKCPTISKLRYEPCNFTEHMSKPVGCFILET